MRSPALFAALLCAACGAKVPTSEASPTAAPEGVEYATQREVPSPQYTRPANPTLPRGEMRREASARPPADAKAVGKLWVERLTAAGVLGGYGLSGKRDDDPVSSIDVLMTAKDFGAWLAREGWTAPRHIDWRFAQELFHPRTSTEALAKVRVWPASHTRTGAQNQALLGGRIYLEDGCFYVDRGTDWGYGPPGKYLVWFGAETGLVVDAEGYLALIDRADGTLKARIGEEMNWAGPNGPPREDEKGVPDLRAVCGDLPIEAVGNVEATGHFRARLAR